jgi:hypothetical protein
MNRVLAITDLTLRTALRSRTFLFLSGLLLLAIYILPGSLKGDGTIEGQVQIMIQYTLGCSFFILALTTIWAGCSAVSHEVQSRTLHQIVSKPVQTWELWAGKWLGVNALNACLLGIVGLGAFLQLQLTIRGPHTPEDAATIGWVLNAHVFQQPLSRPTLDKEVQEIFDTLASEGETELIEHAHTPSEIESVKSTIKHRILSRPLVVAPGKHFEWSFNSPVNQDKSTPFLSYTLMPSGHLANPPMKGKFVFFADDSAHPFLTTQVESRCNVAVRVPIDLPDQFSANRIRVKFMNVEPAEGETIVFKNETALSMSYKASGFLSNMLKALLILFFKLSLIAAIGISCGSMFTLPVAGFLTAFFLCLPQLTTLLDDTSGERLHDHHGHSHEETTAPPSVMLKKAYVAVNTSVAPLSGYSPLKDLARGILIPWTHVLVCAFWFSCVYTIVFAITGIIGFNRRELGLA